MKKEEWTCPKCKNVFRYTENVLMSGCIGKATPIHECGPGFTAVHLRPASKDAKAFWSRVRDRFHGEKK